MTVEVIMSNNTTDSTLFDQSIIRQWKTHPQPYQSVMPFTHTRRDTQAILADIYRDIREATATEIIPKIIDFIARNFACGCEVSHETECIWDGDVKQLKKRLMDCVEAMKLEDKLKG